MRMLLRTGWCLLLLLSALQNAAAQQARLPPEQVKAAYLVNFVRYTEWPPGALAGGRYRIAVLHAPEVAAAAREIAAASGAIGGRTIEVRALDYDLGSPLGRRRLREDLLAADALYIGAAQMQWIFQILSDAQGLPVLTVSDIDGFAAAGGMLALVIDRRHVVFDANPNAIRAAGLNVSAKVLTLARHVVEGGR